MLNVKIKRLTPEAILPTKANEHDAGWDFYAPLNMEPVTIFPHERRTIHTGVSLAVPIGWYLQIMSRSGMASKLIDARAGVIDCTYRGEVGIILHNDGAWGEGYIVEPGAKIAQVVFLMVPDVNWDEVDTLDDTARGSGGYGSSGR